MKSFPYWPSMVLKIIPPHLKSTNKINKKGLQCVFFLVLEISKSIFISINYFNNNIITYLFIVDLLKNDIY